MEHSEETIKESKQEEEKDWEDAMEEMEEKNKKLGGIFSKKLEELKKSETKDWSNLKATVSEMDQKTHKQQVEEKEDFKEKYLRVLAELDNARKRLQKEKQESVRFAIENAIGEFIPLIDSLEKALNFANDASHEIKTWAAGFQMILSQFKEVLHNHGIVAFHSIGNLFDPHYHEAVEIVETQTAEDGIILEEFAKGYKSASRTIRPAQVKVAKKQQRAEEKELINQKKEEPKNEEK